MVVISALVGNLVGFIEGLFTNKKHLGYTFKEQLSDVLPALTLSLLMGIPTFLTSLLPLNIFVVMFLQCIVGAVSYILLSLLFKHESLYYFVNLIKKMIFKRNKEETNA